jgi:hypothetical protein
MTRTYEVLETCGLCGYAPPEHDPMLRTCFECGTPICCRCRWDTGTDDIYCSTCGHKIEQELGEPTEDSDDG